MSSDPRMDEKIVAAAPFARPILEHFRALIHQAIPDVEETIKWGMPHFVYKGKNVAGMSAFKAHCAVIIHGNGRQGEKPADAGMGGYGKVASLADLPPDAELLATLRQAVQRIDESRSAVVRSVRAKSAEVREIAVPEELRAGLQANAAAHETFERLTPAQRRDYLLWVTEAKRAETRAKRIATTIEWLSEGKTRNWQYDKPSARSRDS